jgi:hypothetical protein
MGVSVVETGLEHMTVGISHRQRWTGWAAVGFLGLVVGMSTASPAQASPAQTDPAHAKPAHTGPAHAKPAHIDPAHIDPAHTDPAHAKPARAGLRATGAAARQLAGDPPTAPENVFGFPGEDIIIATWQAATAQGATITGYVATAQPGNRTCQAIADELECTIKNVFNGEKYTLSVVATSAAGDSPARAAPEPVVPDPQSGGGDAPAQPTNATALPGTGMVVVSWAPVHVDHGDDLGYLARVALPANGSCRAEGKVTTCTIRGLTNGDAIRVRVRAHRNGVDGPWSWLSRAVKPGSAPHLPTSTPVAQAKLSSSGGSTVTPGEKTVLTGAGYAPRTRITIGIYSAPRVLVTTTTNAQGRFRVTVTLPTNRSGRHTLVAAGLGQDGTMRYLAKPVTLTAGLAVTGSSVGPVVKSGLLFVLAGAVMALATRRRRVVDTMTGTPAG